MHRFITVLCNVLVLDFTRITGCLYTFLFFDCLPHIQHVRFNRKGISSGAAHNKYIKTCVILYITQLEFTTYTRICNVTPEMQPFL